jgi:hypothetical protein
VLANLKGCAVLGFILLRHAMNGAVFTSTTQMISCLLSANKPVYNLAKERRRERCLSNCVCGVPKEENAQLLAWPFYLIINWRLLLHAHLLYYSHSAQSWPAMQKLMCWFCSSLDLQIKRLPNELTLFFYQNICHSHFWTTPPLSLLGTPAMQYHCD